MNENQILVTVIIPFYNAEKYLQEAILSVRNQTYPFIELIMIDDGSTDGSFEIAKSYENEYVILLQQANNGACVARNKGLAKAKGEFVKFLDADDFLYPEAIEKQIKQISDLEDNEIPFGDFDFVDKDGTVFLQNRFSKKKFLADRPEDFFLSNWEILISSPLHRKHLLDLNGGFDEYLSSGQESDLHFRMAVAGVKFIYYPDQIFAYRSHQDKNRISVGRINQLPDLEQFIYRNNSHSKLLIDKFGSLSKEQIRRFEQSYFSLFRKYTIADRKDDARQSLIKVQEYAPFGIPTFKGNQFYGLLYLSFGYLFGFKNVEHVLSLKPKKNRNKDLLDNVLNG